MRARCGDFTIARIDRIEPSKNIVRGFKAYEQLLEDYPEYRGRVKFLAFLVPSRLSVEEYKTYLEEIMVSAGWINTRFSDGTWQPIEILVGENYPRAIAAMQLYDVLLVNPLIDGMNLVAKEGATVNQNNGVIILSEGAGAAEQLAEGALVVSPADVIGTTEAFHRALEMSLDERHERAQLLRDQVATEDISMWLYHQLRDIRELLSESGPAASQSSAPESVSSLNKAFPAIRQELSTEEGARPGSKKAVAASDAGVSSSVIGRSIDQEKSGGPVEVDGTAGSVDASRKAS
ncbi:MAG: trehalose-6-phosphate synthase [Blastocatellia bacterium]